MLPEAFVGVLLMALMALVVLVVLVVFFRRRYKDHFSNLLRLRITPSTVVWSMAL